MRAYEITAAFGLEHLQRVERTRPDPGPGQVAVAVSAVSLNYRDLMMVRGEYNPRQPLPLVPCSDAAGTVTAVGPGVSRVKVGDRVASCFFQAWPAGAVPRDRAALRSTLGGPLSGTLAEELVLEEGGVVPAPAGLSDVEVATLPCAAVTAYSALIRQGGLQPGDTLLIQGTGGVALFALAFAKVAGARVIITSSSDEKLARAKALGADETINYRATPEWGKAARALTGGLGVDHVLELGGAGTMQESLRAVRAGGHISLIGVLAGGAARLDLTSVLMQNIRIQGVLVGSRADFEAMSRTIVQHDLHPVIDRTFAFEEAPAAFEHMASAGHFGKICVRVG